MTTKRIIGIVLAIVSIIIGSLILINQSSSLMFFQAFGTSIIITALTALIVWLITE